MSEKADYTHQPKPVPNDQPANWDSVIADIHARDEMGARKYGTRLQAVNGRNYATDAYEEALDLVVYLKGLQVEHARMTDQIAQLTRERDESREALESANIALRYFSTHSEEMERQRNVAWAHTDRLNMESVVSEEKLDTVTRERDEARAKYSQLVDSLCSKSWLGRDRHESVLGLARRLRDNQAHIYALEKEER